MTKRAEKAFKPIEDDIDGDQQAELTLDGQPSTPKAVAERVVADVFPQTPSMVLTEDDVLHAEREAKLMDRFFRTDWRWAGCRETAQAEIEACRKVWEMEDVKTSDLAYAHRKMHLFESFLQILEDAPQKKADHLRQQYEEARKRGMPLLDAAEQAAAEQAAMDQDEDVDEETGEVVDDDAE